MKKIFTIILLVIGTLLLGYMIFNNLNGGKTDNVTTDNLTLYENMDPNFSFLYDGSEDGYEILSPKPNSSDTGGLEKALVIINKKERADLLLGTDAREGPPTINIIYFKNPKSLTPQEWIDGDEGFTDFNQQRLTDISEVNIDQIPAIEFIADGLYASRVIVFAYKNRMFMLVGSFIAENDRMSRDFNTLLESFKFGK